MSLGHGLDLSVGRGSGGGPRAPGNNDVSDITILDTTAVVTTPTNNIDGNGYIAAVTFKGMATGQTLTPSKITLTYEEPGFSGGVATYVSRTATGTAAMRMPVPAQWVTGTVYAAGARCVNRNSNTTRIYITSAGGTSGITAPTHTVGSVLDGVGGVLWTYVSDCEQNATAILPAVEVTSGSDAIVYVVLDKYISSGSRNFTCSVTAGAYGSSLASAGVTVTITNNSTMAPLKPVVTMVTQGWQLVRSGGSLVVEATATHPHGRNNRMVDAVKFTVYDNSNVVTAFSSTVSAMTASTLLTTTYGNPVPVYAASFSQAALAAAGLADGMYSIRCEAMPFIGGKWDSDADGFGTTGTWSISTPLSQCAPARIPFELDSDNSVAIYYAKVGTGGNDGTGVASTTIATARATMCATINGAAAKINTANGSLKAGIILIEGGLTLTAFGGSMDSSKTYGTVWLTVMKDQADAGVVTINADTVTAANRICGKRTKFYDVTLNAVSTTAAIANAEAASAGVVAHELWFDNCLINGTGTQSPLSAAGRFVITNSVVTSTATMTGNSRNCWAYMGGCKMDGGGTGSNCQASAAHGNKFVAKAVPSVPTTRYWAHNTQRLDYSDYGCNTWFDCQANVVHAMQSNGSNDGGTTQTTVAFTAASAWWQTLIEANTGAAKGGQISADAIATGLPMLYDLYNTSAGDGQNLAYNETGLVQVKKYAIAKFGLMPDRNSKRDTYDEATNATQPARTGSYPVGFGVEWLCNVITAATYTIPNPANLSGEQLESRSTFTGTIGFTSDRSKLGTSAGNGIYTTTALSTAYSKIGATEQMLPIDLAGTTRATDGTGAVGAYEHA